MSVRFETLPVEIIRRVASFATTETALVLLRCSRRLHDICSDAGLFRGILDNASNRTTACDQPWDTSFLSTTTPVSTIIRYAVADSRARAWVGQDNPRESFDYLNWAPHLGVLDHPFLKSINLPKFLLTLSDKPAEEHEYMALEWLVTLSLITMPQRTGNTARDLEEVHGVFLALTKKEMGNLHTNVKTVMSFVERQLCANDPVTAASPALHQLPVSRLRGRLPVPFDTWTSAKMDPLGYIMTCGAFIQEGQWTGRYTHWGEPSDRGLFLESVDNVKFTVDNSSFFTFNGPDRDGNFDPKDIEEEFDDVAKNGGVEIKTRCRGRDGEGEFELIGTVDPGGSVHLRRPQGSEGKFWNAYVSEWGIFGSWTEKIQGNFKYGELWLWRK